MGTADELRRQREETSAFSRLFDYVRGNEAALAAEGRRPVWGGLLSKEPVMGVDTIRYEGIGPMLAGLLEPVARGVDAPRAAAQGLIPVEDMAGEAFGTAGVAMGGGGAVARPAGSVGMGGRVAELRRQANIERFGYDPDGVQAGSDVLSEYVGQHRAPMRDEGAPAFDLAGDIYPDDIYSPKAVQYYGTGSKSMDRDTVDLLQSLRGEPDADVTIYRAVPRGVDRLNAGDWVTVNKQYALDHGEGALGGDFDIVERTVKAKDIFTNGDSIHEFGYDPSTTAANASKSAGLLGVASDGFLGRLINADDIPAKTDAQKAAKEILQLREQGRASEVTKEMMEQADPQTMMRYTPLDMSHQARMDRARQLGFEDQTYYHGSKDTPELSYFDSIDQYNTEGHLGTIYGTSSPAVANTYLRKSSDDEAAIYPLMVRRDPNDPTISVDGVYSRIPMSIRDDKGQSLIDALPDAAEVDHLNAEMVTNTDAIANAMRDADFSMLRMENVVDRGPYYPDAAPFGFRPQSYKDIELQNEYNKWNRGMLAEANKPATNVMVQDATKLRSPFARFDPEFSHLSNLTAANASPTAGLLSQAGMSEQQAERTEQILQRMGLLD